MKILKAYGTNFSSYENVEISFQNRGLTLISGPTGSGKSTLCDLVPWVLYGRTAKDGAVDEVVRWGANHAVATIELTLGDKTVIITRSRGKGKNDLSYAVDGEIVRGKDLLDTQKKIDALVGANFDLFRMVSYFHEFSVTSTFFTANAKTRRSLIEQVVDLTLSKQLKDNVSDWKKELSEEKKTLIVEKAAQDAAYRVQKTNLVSASLSADRWSEDRFEEMEAIQILNSSFNKTKRNKINSLTEKYEDFEAGRFVEIQDLEQEIKELEAKVRPFNEFAEVKEVLTKELKDLKNEVCPTCGSSRQSMLRIELMENKAKVVAAETENSENIRKLQVARTFKKMKTTAVNPFAAELENVKNSENKYAEKLKELKSQTNPHLENMQLLKKQVSGIEANISALQTRIDDLAKEERNSEDLITAIDAFRVELIKSTVNELEDRTNTILTESFDAEIRVSFTPAEGDKIEVEIQKDGNSCSYSQLSKGQRQLLKLSFGLAVMRVAADRNSFSSNVVFLDEALDGLDDQLKSRSYHLFSGLLAQYENIFVVEHNEVLKALFENVISVTLTDGTSSIEKA